MRGILVVLAITWMVHVSGASEAKAQGNAPVFGREIFITMDTDVVNGWTCAWANLVFEAPHGGLEIVDFLQNGSAPQPPMPVVGYGSWGPIFQDGPYLIEPFWMVSGVGTVGGVWFPTMATVPNPPPGFQVPAFEAQGFGPNQRSGLRISRLDGAAFRLAGLDYAGADVVFEFGTALEFYSDFASFQTVMPVLGTPTILTLTLPAIGPNVGVLHLDPATASFATNVGTGQLSASGDIAGFELTSGNFVGAGSGNVLVGGTVAFNAPFTGMDLVGLSDLVLGAGTLAITAANGAVLFVSGNFQPQSAFWRIPDGPAPKPVRLLPLSPTGATTITRVGPANAELDALAVRLGVEALTIEIELAAAGPKFHRVVKEPEAEPTALVHVARSPGDGSLAFAAYGLQPFSGYRHIFDPNPSGAVGSGPLFGLGLNVFTFEQLFLPPNLPPFRAQAGPQGTFAWDVAPGTLPIGVTCDVAFIEERPTGWVAITKRLTF